MKGSKNNEWVALGLPNRICPIAPSGLFCGKIFPLTSLVQSTDETGGGFTQAFPSLATQTRQNLDHVVLQRYRSNNQFSALDGLTLFLLDIARSVE